MTALTAFGVLALGATVVFAVLELVWAAVAIGRWRRTQDVLQS